MSDVAFVFAVMFAALGLALLTDRLVTYLFPPREPWDNTDQLPSMGRALTRQEDHR